MTLEEFGQRLEEHLPEIVRRVREECPNSDPALFTPEKVRQNVLSAGEVPLPGEGVVDFCMGILFPHRAEASAPAPPPRPEPLRRIVRAALLPCDQDPPCGPWLAGHSDRPPLHVCHFAAMDSVDWFVSGQHGSLSTHPLPAGSTAIAEWWRANRESAAAPYPALLQHHPGASIGLASLRADERAVVWCLGLVEKVPFEDAAHLEKYLPLAGVGGDFFRFAGSILLAEGDVTEPLWRRVRAWQKWYTRKIKGEKFHSGRTPGSGASFQDGDADEFFDLCREAFAHCKRFPPADQTNVFQYIAKEKGLFGHDPRTLRGWCKQFGTSWKELQRRFG